MFPTLFVFGFVADLAAPATRCGDEEFVTEEGRCCPLCHEGTVVRKDCTPHSVTRCGPCLYGTFMNHRNHLNECYSCTSCDPGLGLFEKEKCTLTTDAVCDVLSGYFCKSLSDDATGCSLAQKHKDCESGQRIKEHGTSRSDTVCEDCQPGYFSEDGVTCTAWTVCSETQTKVKEGTLHTDVVCENASRNHYILILPFCLLVLTLCSFVTGVSSTRSG